LIPYNSSSPPASSFFSPYSSIRNCFTPGEQFLILAHIKTSIEHQIMPRQIVYDAAAGQVIMAPFWTTR
jgi:hypothetical protein